MRLLPKHQFGSTINSDTNNFLNTLSPPKVASIVAPPDATKVDNNINKLYRQITPTNPYNRNQVINLALDKNGNFTDEHINNMIHNWEGTDYNNQRVARQIFTKAYNQIPNREYLNRGQQLALIDSLYTLGVGGNNWNNKVSILKTINPNNYYTALRKLRRALAFGAPNRIKSRLSNYEKAAIGLNKLNNR